MSAICAFYFPLSFTCQIAPGLMEVGNPCKVQGCDPLTSPHLLRLIISSPFIQAEAKV